MKKRILSALLAAAMLVGMIVMPATAAEGKMPFTDVKSGKWYYEAVEYAWKNDLMNGVTETAFEPETAMNRGMLVTVLWRAEGSPEPKGTTPFTDLKQNYYKKAVAWAYENEVVNGMTDVAFAPSSPITREQIATIIYRYAKYAGRDVSAKGDLSKFPDESKVAKFAKEAMTWAVGEGLISGTKIDGKDYLDPKGSATRAQVATILMRYLESAKDPMYDKINEILYDIPCDAHGKIDVYFGPGDTLTEENMNAFLTGLFDLGDGYTVIVDSDAFAELKEAYGGAGEGDSGWYDDVPVTFTNTATGETTTEEIDLDIIKTLNGYWAGALSTYALTYCWDDVPAVAKDALNKTEDIKDTEILLEGEEYTPEVIEAYLREVTGLTDAEAWEFFIGGFNADLQYDGNEVNLALRNVVDGRTYIFGMSAVFKIERPDPMYQSVEKLTTTDTCKTHGEIDVQFSKSDTFTEENMNAFFAGMLELGDGYAIAVDSAKFAEIKEQYDAAENGSFSTEIGLTVTNTETEEKITENVKLSIRKDTYAEETGAVGCYALTVCPDDLPADVLAAEEAVSGYTGETVVTIPGTVYSPLSIENWYRETAGLGEGWTFHIAGYHGDDPYDGNNVTLVLKNENVNGEGRTYTVGCRVALRIEPDAVDPMYGKIENVLTDIPCDAHEKIDVQFGKSATFTEENMNAFLTGLFNLGVGYSVTVDPAQFAAIKEGYGGAGDGALWEDIDVTFTNTETGETTTETLHLAIRKDTAADETGAVESFALTVCPDELPDDITDAAAAVAGYSDETVVTLEGRDYNEDVIEAWYRGVTGLGDGWTFHIAWFNGDQQYDGNEVLLVLKNENVNGEGRTYTVGCNVVLKINVPPADPPSFTDIDYDVSEDHEGALINDEAAFTAWVLEYLTTRFEFPQDSIEIRNYSDLKAAYDAMIAADTYMAASTISLTYHSSDATAAAIDATYDFYFVGGTYVEPDVDFADQTCDFSFDVRKVDPSGVVKDGVISEGEYYRVVCPKPELINGVKSPRGKTVNKLRQIKDTAKFYFSWDPEHGFNIAVEFIAPDLIQTNTAYVYDGRLAPKASPDPEHPEMGDSSEELEDPTKFYGPLDGFMGQTALVFSGAPVDGERIYYAIGKNVETGEYLRGHYFFNDAEDDGHLQYGYNPEYYPQDDEMAISYGKGNRVVFEYSIPFATILPEGMIGADGSVVNGTQYGVNLTLCNGWNEEPNTISGEHKKDFFDPSKVSPVLFGDLGAFMIIKKEKVGKVKVQINRSTVATFINN